MLQSQDYAASPSCFSPLVLIDRLISLAEEADHAGMENVAGNLIVLAYSVGDEPTN